MSMSSFLMNSSPFAEPKFPPSEEYSQNNYISGQSEDYYHSRTGHHANFMFPPDQPRMFGQDGYHHHGPASAAYSSCGSGPPSLPHRGPGPEDVGQVAGAPGYSQRSSSTPQVPSPTSQASTPGLAPCSQASSPPIIYPWMKKVHMGSGKCDYCLYSRLPCLVLLLLPVSTLS